MQTFTIRVSPKEKTKIANSLNEAGLSLNATCKLIAFRTIELGYFPNLVKRSKRKEPRTELLHAKLDKNVIVELRKISDAVGVSTSDLFRSYLQQPRKLFEKRRSGFNKRSTHTDPRDYFQTPKPLVKVFLEQHFLDAFASICEPAAGGNAIVDAIAEYRPDLKITHFDKHDDENPKCFLNDYDETTDYLITNPPFNQALEFIQKSFEVTRKQAMFLLPLDYLQSKTRYDALFSNDNINFKLSHTYIFNRRPIFTQDRQDEKLDGTGVMTMAWFVFTKDHDKPATIHHLDITDYLQRKKEKPLQTAAAFQTK